MGRFDQESSGGGASGAPGNEETTRLIGYGGGPGGNQAGSGTYPPAPGAPAGSAPGRGRAEPTSSELPAASRMPGTSTLPGSSVSRASSPTTYPAVSGAPVKVKGAGTIALVGLLTVLLGAWAGIVPFVGPVFGFGATGSPAWTWRLLHVLLWAVPGALSVLCGLIMLAKAPSVRRGKGGGGVGLVGFLAVLCGAWLVIGPIAWQLIETGGVFTTGSPWRGFLTRLGYSYGPGILLAMLGGCAMGLAVGRRVRGATAPTSSIPTGSHMAR